MPASFTVKRSFLDFRRRLSSSPERSSLVSSNSFLLGLQRREESGSEMPLTNNLGTFTLSIASKIASSRDNCGNVPLWDEEFVRGDTLWEKNFAIRNAEEETRFLKIGRTGGKKEATDFRDKNCTFVRVKFWIKHGVFHYMN